MRLTHVGLGARFAGQCAVCSGTTGSKDWERKETCLYRDEAGKYRVVHPRCAGAKIGHAVSGAAVYKTPAAETIEV